VATIAVPGCGSDDCPECSRDLAQYIFKYKIKNRQSTDMMIRLCERAHHSGIGEDGFYAPYAALTTRAITLVPDSKFLSYVVFSSIITYSNRYTVIRRSSSHRRGQNQLPCNHATGRSQAFRDCFPLRTWRTRIQWLAGHPAYRGPSHYFRCQTRTPRRGKEDWCTRRRYCSCWDISARLRARKLFGRED
jgi:hypothetical protein